MAYDMDNRQTFPISLDALLEGFGKIVEIEVENQTQGISYIWDGSWATLPHATEGDDIMIRLLIRNDGDTTDTLYVEIITSDVAITAPRKINENVAIGESYYVGWLFQMPPNDINMTIDAGHVEPD